MNSSDLLKKYEQEFEGCKMSGKLSSTMVFAYHAYRSKTTDFVSLEEAIMRVTDPAEASKQMASKFPKTKYVLEMKNENVPGYVILQRACETEEGVLFNVPPGSNAAMYTKGIGVDTTVPPIPPHITILFDSKVSAHLTPYKTGDDGKIKYWKPSAALNKHVEITEASLKELLTHEPTLKAAEEFGVKAEFEDLCTQTGKHMQRVSEEGSGITGGSGADGLAVHPGATEAIRQFVRALERYPEHDYNADVHRGIACMTVFSTEQDWFGVIEHEASQKAVRVDGGRIVSESPFWNAWSATDSILELDIARDFEEDFRQLLSTFIEDHRQDRDKEDD